jgi:hypothetical protein
MNKLLPKQENAIYYLKDQTTTEVLYGGAAGGGKSSFGCIWLAECCLNYPGTRWLMGRSKLKTLRETTLNTFHQEMKALGLSNQYSYNDQKHIIFWNNGSEIILKDLFYYPSDPEFDSLGSLEITGAFIDECNQITAKAWQIVKSRIRYKLSEFDVTGLKTSDLPIVEWNDEGVPIEWKLPNGKTTKGLIPKLLGTCNPAKNWTYKNFYKAKKNGTIRDYQKFIQALPTDNPYLPPSYLESLLQLDKNSKRRLYFGDWEYDDDPSMLIDVEAITDYFNPAHIVPSGRKYITVDVARKGKDKSVIRVWHGWLCIQRKAIPKNDLIELSNIIRGYQKTYGIPNSQTIADEDGVGGGVVDILRCVGFINNSSALNGANYSNLKSQCSIEMARMIQDRKVGEISELSGDDKDQIGEEMEQIKLKDIDKDSKLSIVSKEDIKQMIGRSPDDWDSIMMRYYFQLKPPATAPRSTLI